jgi:TolB-like protein/class 3 adenylate cyclase/Flp pilus assembly protein TadD
VGDFRVDATRNEVSRDGVAVRLEPKVVEVLVHLAARAGEVVSRDELMSSLWPGVVVGDDAVTQAIIKLRRALGDDAHQPTYIETISKRGYRLIAAVETDSPPAAAAPGESQPDRRLAAILSADIAGYSRLMGENDLATMQALQAHQAAVLPLMEKFSGRVIDLAGDGILAEFPSAVGAVGCAIEVQRVMGAANATVARARRLQFRIGIHIGDVIHDGGRLFGDGINIAARIQALARPGGILVSQVVVEQVRNKVPAQIVRLGAASLKNIREPVVVHQVAGASGSGRPEWLERWSFATRGGGMGRARIALALALLLVAGGATVALLGKTVGMPWPLSLDTRGASVASLPVIAVLPMANLSSEPGRDHFSDGVTEDIINGLGRFSGLRVISPNAVQAYKAKAPSPSVIRTELGAHYVVQGSVRQADGQVRVAVSLSDTDKGVHLWSEKYDGTGGQIFEIQDRVVKSIVAKLAVKVTQAEEQRVFTKPTQNMEAHELVLRARALLKRTDRAQNREARELLGRARELAPDYAETFTTLCDADLQRAMYGWMEDVRGGMQQAEQWCMRALDAPDERAHTHAHVSLASIYSNQLRFEDAVRHAKRAIELNPSDARALHREAAALLYGGRIPESLPVFELARRYDPHASAGERYNLAVAYFMADRPEEALAEADAILARNPNHAVTHAIRAAALAGMGREAEARAAAEQVRRYSPYFAAQHFGTRFIDPRLNERLQAAARRAGL